MMNSTQKHIKEVITYERCGEEYFHLDDGIKQKLSESNENIQAGNDCSFIVWNIIFTI